MEWIEYREQFITTAKKANKNSGYIKKNLKYAEKLYNQKLPIIYNASHFSKLVGYSLQYLYAASNDSSKFYREFEIKKKNGSSRKISEPLPSLKEIQKWILENILNKIQKEKVSKYAKAYQKKISIKENVKFHRVQKKVLSLDITNFFLNIKIDKIYEVFYNLGYSKSLSTLFSNLCTLNYSLPQGAPTSPILSNIVMLNFDNEIEKIVLEKRIRYTRYADDMTFSGDFLEKEIIKYVKENLNKIGLKINNKKTRVRKNWQQQMVTGIIVNEKIQISRKKRDELRQTMYYIEKYGIDSFLKYKGIKNKVYYLSHLKGVLEYAYFINKNDKKLFNYIEYLKNNFFKEKSLI